MPASVLVVEDDPGVLEVGRFHVATRGPSWWTRAATARRPSRPRGRGVTTIVITRRELPGFWVTDVAARCVTERTCDPQVTARDAESDRVVGIEIGADD